MDAKPAALPTDEDQHMAPAAMAAAMRAPRPLLRGPGTIPAAELAAALAERDATPTVH